ncbi:hypothetical protein IFM89_019411 [Coptis chinensis]|uniref:Phospholipase A1 n=1 Tax=Coptis chinensis TaxID=261450 RepID=A0A835M6S3_9MAGN|nr:hypothetical protein IFM89_019411 [Coptis chinensis]
MEITKTEPKWEAILGSNQWEGLLNPLHIDLRKLILVCGDFCQVTYDSFNNDQHSKYCGSSLYGKKSLFNRVALQNASNYYVASFLYATSRVEVPSDFIIHSFSTEAWDRESNWMGYIAVTSDEFRKASGRREIYVAWRGTIRPLEWVDVLQPKLVSVESLLKINDQSAQQSSSDTDDDDTTMKVMKGWLTVYTSNNANSPFTKLSARTQLLTKIKELVNLYKDENISIVFTGHSLGASLSILSAFDVAENVSSTIPVSAIVFGCPEVGNKVFKDKLKTYPNLKILHIKNVIDPIPHYPSKVLGYVHTGTELDIDTRKSPYLKNSPNPSDWHNLQAMLHIIAGWNGNDGKFELKVKRSVALVNKSCDFLKDEYLVLAAWWIEKNRGMVLDKDGEWGLGPPIDEDIPVPEF